MPERRVVRDGTSVALETAYAITGKVDGGSAEPFKVPQRARRLIAIEAGLSAEALAAVQENSVAIIMSGDGLPGGPYTYPIGGHSSGTTSTAGLDNPLRRIPTDLAVVPGGTIDVNGYNVGDTIIVMNLLIALVFEE